MKFLLVLALVGVAAADRLENTYLPPTGAAHAGGSAGAIQAPYAAAGGRGGAGGAGGRYAAPVNILKYSNDNNGEGTYSYSFETENGINTQESGYLKNAGSEAESSVVTGSYSYTDPTGQLITVTYTADENGFHAEGAHLPTPPPIPEAILRSLEQNAAEEAAAARGGGQGGYSSGPAVQPQSAYLPPQNAYVPPQNAYVPPKNAYIPPAKSAQPPRRQGPYNY